MKTETWAKAWIVEFCVWTTLLLANRNAGASSIGAYPG